MKVAIVLGTRPEIIKFAPVVRALERHNIEHFIIHTGQHYSEDMDAVFFEELQLGEPRYNLGFGSLPAYLQVAAMIEGIGNTLKLRVARPDLVLVLGDTNSALAGALAANKLGVKVGHIEAGLRSGDRTMPEEINRILVDHVADYLFAPTQGAVDNLVAECIGGGIFETGNTIVDATLQYAPENIVIPAGATRVYNPYILATLHRAENVGNVDRLLSAVASLKEVAAAWKMPVILPLHPHTRRSAIEFGIPFGGLEVVKPVGYLEFLTLLKGAEIVLTDSGGVQEEACILHVPCVTLRDNTERPETVEVGANIVAGVDPVSVMEAVRVMAEVPRNWANPFGDGKAAERIVEVLESL